MPQSHSSAVLHDPNDPWAPKHVVRFRILKLTLFIGIGVIVLGCSGVVLYAISGEW